MAFEKTVISASVGGKLDSPGMIESGWFFRAPSELMPVGDPWHPPMLPPTDLFTGAENRPEDVTKIQKLLNLIYRPASPLPEDGVINAAVVTAIVRMQELCGLGVDGVIGPSGTTLRHLNAIAKPAKITHAQVGTGVQTGMENGIYHISYSSDFKPDWPPGYQLFLSVGEASPMVYPRGLVPKSEFDFGVDVTGTPKRWDILTEDHAAPLLEAMGKFKDPWAKPCKIRLYLLREGYLVWESNEPTIPAPVAPYEGPLNPGAFAHDKSLPKMIYVGTGDHPFIGRRLWQIGDKYWFRYGAQITTQNIHRGMDCINFIGSLYQMRTDPPNPYHSSPNMAAALGATAVEWTETLPAPDPAAPPAAPAVPLKIEDGKGKGKAIKKYFEDPFRTQTYLLWTGGHIRIVVRKTVHEWSSKANGYKAGPVSAEATVADNTTYHLYSLPANRQF